MRTENTWTVHNLVAGLALTFFLFGCGTDGDKTPEYVPADHLPAGTLDSGPDLNDAVVGRELHTKPEVPIESIPHDVPVDQPGPPPDVAPADASQEVLDDVQGEVAEVLAKDVAAEIDAVPKTIGELCFPAVYQEGAPGPQYDQFAPTIASHCFGTNHQDIKGIKEVVFLGDSVTVGTPNVAHLLSVDNSHFYRNKMAEWLALHFGLETDNLWEFGQWKMYDYFTGKGVKKISGDFRHCAYWGARTDDFLGESKQLMECLPSGTHSEPILFLVTMGGNDIAKITQVGAEATPEEVTAGYPAAWALAESTVAYLEEGVAYVKDPANFPAGAFIIYGNGFEFTDGTGQTSACTPQFELDIPGIGEIDLSDLGIPVALLAGYGEWEKPEVQADIVIWMLEQYMRIAVEYQADMIWTVESFCGHGYVASGDKADPETVCYLGPDSDLYFDETCVHPSPAGHNALFEMFKAVVLE